MCANKDKTLYLKMLAAEIRAALKGWRGRIFDRLGGLLGPKKTV